MYDLEGFFVANPIDRYLINDRTDLHVNPDGSIDISVQSRPPSDSAQRKNWLPAPAGSFRMIFRLYAPRQGRMGGILDGSGWRPPLVEPVP